MAALLVVVRMAISELSCIENFQSSKGVSSILARTMTMAKVHMMLRRIGAISHHHHQDMRQVGLVHDWVYHMTN